MSRKYRYNDLGIIEKVVRAYSLLDMLARSGCPYIFKGGTCVGCGVQLAKPVGYSK